jgi:sigma-B regulation protein RsbU (phosphoserine phosphatase)
MDIAMPDQSGIEAAVQIQCECPAAVVILSAHHQKEDIARATAAGVGAFLVKPPQADDLLRAISIATACHGDLMRLHRANVELERALTEVRTLKGMLPICSGCKKIRDDRGYWLEVERYIMANTDATFSHSLCPGCSTRYFPDLK